ncbi:hypothetical protein GCM10010214_31370 [Streptomyces abikoensis]|nr:hypothetical protein GCM10010214_31370 [Streptomyces abikoensis]
MNLPPYIPYIGGRLASGSLALGTCIWSRACTWCASSYRDDLSGLKAALGPIARGGVLLAAGWGGICGVTAAPDTLFVIAFAWGIGAWKAAPVADHGEGADEPEPSSAADSESPAPAVTLEAFSALVRELAQGGAGAHFSTLAKRLTGDKHNTAAMRALCATHGVPHAESVRQGVGASSKVSSGVRIEDLPTPSPAPAEAPAVAVVSAGQHGATNPATATTTPLLQRNAWGNTLPAPAHRVATPRSTS